MKGKQIHSYITNAGISELNGLQRQALEINEKQQDVILYAPTGSISHNILLNKSGRIRRVDAKSLLV